MKLVETVPSGIPGLDELLGGGLPKGRAILVSGGPGTGKSILGAQFIYNGAAQYGIPGIIVSLEEPQKTIKENLSGFGWDLDKFIDENLLAIIDASPIQRSTESGDRVYEISGESHPILGERSFNIENLVSLIHEKRREINAQRITVDSITNLTLQHKDLFQLRQDVLTLVRSLKATGVTSILTAESLNVHEMGRYGLEPFIAEGVILLYMLRQGNTKIRALEIMKMRGINHSMDAAFFRITEKGIVLYPEERVFKEDVRGIIW
ncbi:MAG: ATPase domain-containing protein [Candidatus Jordarchaeaceae archaeon]